MHKPLKVIETYETRDGATFTSREEATRHEHGIAIPRSISKLLKHCALTQEGIELSPSAADKLALVLVSQSVVFGELLSDYTKLRHDVQQLDNMKSFLESKRSIVDRIIEDEA
jgi:hypothetical protein